MSEDGLPDYNHSEQQEQHMNDIATYEQIGSPLSVSAIKQQVQLIQEIMREVMVADVHYGKIPGTDKNTLYKAGADKLCLTFRLAPTYVVTKTSLPDGHQEYEVRCTITHIPSGKVFGEGVGTCSTMESKYRYRNVADFELTGEPIPKDAKERKKEYRKAGFGMKKVEGTWEWVKYGDSARQENPDIADTYNTIIKMGKKRAYVDAVITATAASDIFNQDFGDPETDEEVEIIQARPENENPNPESWPPKKPAPQTVIPEEIKNDVHDKTLAYMAIGDAVKMRTLWKLFGADEQVELWKLFDSRQRSTIKELMKNAGGKTDAA